jgi:hypothetical protein
MVFLLLYFDELCQHFAKRMTYGIVGIVSAALYNSNTRFW